jgi:hypothetical protein
MDKSGLNFRKNPVAMSLVCLAALADGFLSLSGHARGSSLGLAVGFAIQAMIAFLLWWGLASSFRHGRGNGSVVRELRSHHERAESLSKIAQ